MDKKFDAKLEKAGITEKKKKQMKYSSWPKPWKGVVFMCPPYIRRVNCHCMEYAQEIATHIRNLIWIRGILPVSKRNADGWLIHKNDQFMREKMKNGIKGK